VSTIIDFIIFDFIDWYRFIFFI